MDSEKRLDLSRMIKEYNTEETTDKIRELKHSRLIRDDITKIQEAKKNYTRIQKSDFQKFKNICQKRAKFLYDNYTNIFNKIVNDEIDLEIMAKFLAVLKRIEDGYIDQHEGSFEIGSLLKELFIDSALRRDANKKEKTHKYKKAVNNISWSDFKKI